MTKSRKVILTLLLAAGGYGYGLVGPAAGQTWTQGPDFGRFYYSNSDTYRRGFRNYYEDYNRPAPPPPRSSGAGDVAARPDSQAEACESRWRWDEQLGRYVRWEPCRP